MSKWRKPLGVVTLSGAILGTAVLGVDLFHDGQFAMAEQSVSATRQQLSTIQDTSQVYRDVHHVVEPSVVEIRVIKTLPHAETQIPPMFQHFFHDFGDNGGQQFNLPPGFFGNNGDNEQGPIREVGTGSGVIMDV